MIKEVKAPKIQPCKKLFYYKCILGNLTIFLGNNNTIDGDCFILTVIDNIDGSVVNLGVYDNIEDGIIGYEKLIDLLKNIKRYE